MVSLRSFLRNNQPVQHPSFFVFQWHITDCCDQRCRHCYIYHTEPGKQPDSMPWETMKTVVEQCRDFCAIQGMRPHFCLTGGDPLLHPSFDSLTRLLHDERIPFSILGNPFHLTQKLCRQLKKRGCVQYQMSIDGLEKTHDSLRMPGSYRETMEKVALLNECGLKSVIMTTVSGRNIDEIPAVIRAMAEARVGLYAFARYCPTGEDRDNGITPARYRKLLNDCAVTIRGLLDGGCVTRFSKKDHLWTLYDYEQGRFTPPEDSREGVVYGGCHCGQTHLTILPNGDVYACRRVLSSRVGTLPQDALSDIWINGLEPYRHLERFEKCASCPLLSWCRGCPAVACATHGSFYSPDPQCWKK